MTRFKNWLAALVMCSCAVLAGCQPSETLKDGYQFGDGTRAGLDMVKQAAEYRYQYCVKGDQESRALLVGMMKILWPSYPVAGICTNSHPLLALLSVYGIKANSAGAVTDSAETNKDPET